MMRSALWTFLLSTLLFAFSGRADAVSWGIFGEWSGGGSQSFGFQNGAIELKMPYAIDPTTGDFIDSVPVPDSTLDQSQWSLGAAMDTNVARDSLFAYRLLVGYERSKKSAASMGDPTNLYLSGSPSVFTPGVLGDVYGNGLVIDNIFGFGVMRRERFKLWLGPEIRLGFQANQYPFLGTGFEFNAGAGVRAGINYHVNERISIAVTLGYTYIGRVGGEPIGNTSGRYDDTGYTQSGNAFGINTAIFFRGAGDQFVR